jgi:hypothetical protein
MLNVSTNPTLSALTGAPNSAAATPLLPNRTVLFRLVDDLVEVLNEGPVAFDPRVAMTLAIATPLAVLSLCVVCMVCRGVPYVMCGGKCSYWRRMPKEPIGLEPDGAIGEYQDEHCDVDSVDEDTQASRDMPDDELEDEDPERLREVGLANANGCNGQRECCNTIAAVLESGGLERAASPPNPSSEKSVVVTSSTVTTKKKGAPNGKAKAVHIMAPE